MHISGTSVSLGDLGKQTFYIKNKYRDTIEKTVCMLKIKDETSKKFHTDCDFL